MGKKYINKIQELTEHMQVAFRKDFSEVLLVENVCILTVTDMRQTQSCVHSAKIHCDYGNKQSENHVFKKNICTTIEPKLISIISLKQLVEP